jgi:hypothetical protein
MTSATAAIVFAALTAGFTTSASAQLGRQQGLLEPNVAADSQMLRLALITPATVESLKGAIPILSITTLDSILGSKGLTRAQRTDLYGKMFIHVDLNRGTDAELLLIPGVDAPKLAAIKAGRPFKSFDQFATAMAKTANPAEVTRLEQYLFIPIDLNTFVDPIMDTFAGINVGTPRWKREFAEYRPWTSMAQFEREISKYLRSRPTELKRLQRYVIINP